MFKFFYCLCCKRKKNKINIECDIDWKNVKYDRMNGNYKK
jgi:hypothetical protein